MKAKTIFLLAAMTLMMAGVLYLFPRLRLHLPYLYSKLETYAIAAFRNPICSFSDAVKGLSFNDCAKKKRQYVIQSCRLLQKDEKGFELWSTPKGPVWAPPGSGDQKFLGLYMVQSIFLEQECNEYGTEKQGVYPGDIVLDCGAHIGLFVKKALEAGAQTVVAIEPAPDNIECLRRNFSKEIQDGRVIVYPKGVWNKDDELSFKVEKISGGDAVIEGAEEGEDIIKIPVTTIDKIVEDLKLERVDFVKMDIEGAEQNALMGARQTIVTHHPRMAIATEHTDDVLENARKVSSIIQGFADYCVECGHCVKNPKGIVPFVVFFR